MSRYYLLTDYVIPIFAGGAIYSTPFSATREEKLGFYEEYSHVPRPKTKVVLSLEPNVRLYVAYHDIDVGHFVIKADTRGRAYEIATLLRAFFSLYHGWQTEANASHFFLQELKRLPQPEWDTERMFKELREFNRSVSEIILYVLREGYYVAPGAYKSAPSFVKQLWNDTDMIETFSHLMESRFLFDGFMVGSYYILHYAPERKIIPLWVMEKRYFENRYRYETSFIAAFKAIERFFGVNQIKKNTVAATLNQKSHLGIREDTMYTRSYEIFSGHPRSITYKDLICHFLDLRNIVAAHGNKNPPKHAKLIEDNILEIQLFLMELLNKVVRPGDGLHP